MLSHFPPEARSFTALKRSAHNLELESFQQTTMKRIKRDTILNNEQFPNDPNINVTANNTSITMNFPVLQQIQRPPTPISSPNAQQNNNNNNNNTATAGYGNESAETYSEVEEYMIKGYFDTANFTNTIQNTEPLHLAQYSLYDVTPEESEMENTSMVSDDQDQIMC
ncbi:hypothetical protein NCAS_0G03380 [Naumovozyma castellii]|uniref:Uncharacterized protein n=1 Tax=Naumovozyma castellii TaxID=27288 RepID=G0VIJ0_NAUCA|nr:hypothetical protein NCAS_0G03380 [Naumovozyma castellii CBS 4309]CCC71225.1 hypothetical protein NCAS_0G03380 [Naumovozyma castellii CBS 4309]